MLSQEMKSKGNQHKQSALKQRNILQSDIQLLVYCVVSSHQMMGSNFCDTVKLNSNRHVTGVLRGFDQFMNIVLDQTVDEKGRTDIGMVVSCSWGHVPHQQASVVMSYLW